jgi:homopolymeric O-antigen transport system ATP-binding protein
MTNPTIRVNNLGKLYHIGERDNYRTLRDTIVRSFQRTRKKIAAEHIWALRNISFDVHEGEVVGCIGGNGAGKSTLLKLLSRITEPTEGEFELRGRVSSLLDIGVGFHPELTGRENVYLSGAILGMKKREIDRKFHEIVEFSELKKFIDTPIKHYSTGMWVRLGFSVAAHMEPEILLVDEVLSAGDAAFQTKCLGKIDEVTGQGRTVLMVSHNLKAIADLCEKCIWIDRGHITRSGMSSEVIVAYLESTQPQRTSGKIEQDMHENPHSDVLFRHVAVLNENDQHVTKLFFGETLRIKIEFEVVKPIGDLRIAASLERHQDGVIVTAFHNVDNPGFDLLNIQPGTYSLRIETKLPLSPGGYSINLEVKPASGVLKSGRNWDTVRRAIDFNIEEFTKQGSAVPSIGGVIRLESKWTLDRHS